MVAEGALEEDADSPGSCKVHPTFTAIVEGKAATLVDNNFFLLTQANSQHCYKRRHPHNGAPGACGRGPSLDGRLRARPSSPGSRHLWMQHMRLSPLLNQCHSNLLLQCSHYPMLP